MEETRESIDVPGGIPKEPPPAKRSSKSKKEFSELFDHQKRSLVHHIFLFGVGLGALLLALVFVIRIYHFITPPSWQWLTEDQLHMVDKFLFSGIVGALIGRHFNKLFE